MASLGARSTVSTPLAAPSGARSAPLSDGGLLAVERSANRMLWPSTNGGGFSRMAPNHANAQPVKMMRAPDVYVATYDTMPPQQQVIHTVPTHDALRQLYQQTDRKMTGKRDSASSGSDRSLQGEPRPAKTPRAT